MLQSLCPCQAWNVLCIHQAGQQAWVTAILFSTNQNIWLSLGRQKKPLLRSCIANYQNFVPLKNSNSLWAELNSFLLQKVADSVNVLSCNLVDWLFGGGWKEEHGCIKQPQVHLTNQQPDKRVQKGHHGHGTGTIHTTVVKSGYLSHRSLSVSVSPNQFDHSAPISSLIKTELLLTGWFGFPVKTVETVEWKDLRRWADSEILNWHKLAPTLILQSESLRSFFSSVCLMWTWIEDHELHDLMHFPDYLQHHKIW